MRKGVRVSWVAAASVVTTSSGPVGLACKAASAASRSELERSDGELRSYGRQSHAGNWMLFSSGAKYPAASHSDRIAAPSAELKIARAPRLAGPAARERPAIRHGRETRSSEGSPAGTEGVRTRKL